MATVYYYQECVRTFCPHCKLETTREMVKRQIGARAAGYRFTFRRYPELGLTTFGKWADFLADRDIYDEYGREIQTSDFLTTVVLASRRYQNVADAVARVYTANNYSQDPLGFHFVDKDWDEILSDPQKED